MPLPALLRCKLLLGFQLAVAGPAAEYLSEDFFPGFHILESLNATRFHVYARGQKSNTPAVVDLQNLTFAAAQARVESLLKIRPRELLQPPCAFFTSDGQKIEDLQGFEENPVIFLIEAGQWMWPAVRVGFQQNVTELPGVSLKTLALRPVIFEVQNFMTHQEAAEIVALGQKQVLEDSKGQMQSNDLKLGTSHASFRTSRQAWLDNELSPIIAALDERTAMLTRIPQSHNEAAQLLRYDAGNYYHMHVDWTELDYYPDQRDIWMDSHFGHYDRLATVFWYLNDVENGGETIFPKHQQPICNPGSMGGPTSRSCRSSWYPETSSCDHGLKVKPRSGSAILWYNFLATGRGDRNALHAACPVGKNETKWSVNKWVRNKPWGNSPGEWIDGHPALKRFGWRDKTSQDFACHIAFQNQFPGPVKLYWIHDGDHELASISEKGSLAQLSYHGHRFQVASGDRRSNEVRCSSPSSDFYITRTLQLTPSDAGEL